MGHGQCMPHQSSAGRVSSWSESPGRASQGPACISAQPHNTQKTQRRHLLGCLLFEPWLGAQYLRPTCPPTWISHGPRGSVPTTNLSANVDFPWSTWHSTYDQPVRQRGFPMVHVRHDAEVAYTLYRELDRAVTKWTQRRKHEHTLRARERASDRQCTQLGGYACVQAHECVGAWCTLVYQKRKPSW